MPGADRPHMRKSLRRRERLEYRLAIRHGALGAAYHQAVAILQSPDAAARARIDEVDAPATEHLAAAYGVLEIGISPVDHDVALTEMREQPGNRVVHGRARGH